MIATLTEAKFRREYPACMEDAFAARDSLFVSHDALGRIESAYMQGNSLELEKPVKHDRYVIGADIGGGVGGDYSTLMVVSATTRQPVYVARSNTVQPHEWASKLVETATRYNNALCLVESNNHGHTVIREMTHTLRYKNMWVTPDKKWWTTTVKSKLDALDTLREYLTSGLVTIMDHVTLMELRSLVSTGPTPAAPSGGHDDMVMAAALAYRALRDLAAPYAGDGQVRITRMDDMIAKTRSARIRKANPFGANSYV